MNINATLLGQMITFSVFVAVTMKYIWPPLTEAMENRRQGIAKRLQQAEDAERDALATREKTAASLQTAEQKAKDIVQQAQGDANQLLHETQKKSLLLEKKMLEQSEQKIKKQQQHAKKELQAELFQLILAGAERVVGERLDPKTHQTLIDRFISEAL